jgi:large subunit ribosomal protein L2
MRRPDTPIKPVNCSGRENAEIVKRESLLLRLPEKIKEKLQPNLASKQLKKVIVMHSNQVELPSHMLLKDPLGIPPKGCVKELSIPLRKKGGRNHHGRITVRHIGGGFKRRIRIVDGRRDFACPQKVIRIEHDPNRSAKLALLQCTNTGKLSYIIAPQRIDAGSTIDNNPMRPVVGTTLPLRQIPSGEPIHNIQINHDKGGQLVRSAGTSAQIVGRNTDKGTVNVKLPSGSIKQMADHFKATIGVVGNEDWHLRVIGKAGRNRNLGIRPTVRGVAMNAVDHPHGGGKGGKSKGKPSQSPWGKICK